MECLPGRTLVDELRAGPFRRRTVAVLDDILAALETPREGVLHRDIKPGNVLLDEAVR